MTDVNENIFESIPPYGTVLLTLTEEELEKYRETSIKITSLEKYGYGLRDAIDLFQQYERERVEFWVPIYKKHGIP